MKTHKAVVGEDYVYLWRSPGVLSTAPTLTVTPPASGATFGGTMSAVCGPGGISSIASDRRTITLSAAIEAPATPPNGLVGDQYGAVAIQGQRGGFALAKVAYFEDSTTVVLAEPLPHTVDVSDILADSGASAAIQWLTYSYTLSAADLGADPNAQFLGLSSSTPSARAATHRRGCSATGACCTSCARRSTPGSTSWAYSRPSRTWSSPARRTRLSRRLRRR